MTITPIPNGKADLLNKGAGGNSALFFSRMATWTCGWNGKEEKLESKYQKGTDHKGKAVTDSSIVKLGQEINHRLSSIKPVLDNIHTRQTAILKTVADRGVMVWEFRARLVSPYVSGLGSGHPTETGMILDRNSGLPYIPASAIKGVLRMACALQIAESEPGVVVQNKRDPNHLEVPDDHANLRRYFGDTDTGKADSVRGQLVFLDSFPTGTPTIRTDIMNPHFGKYYAGDQGPLETENPIPVKFLTVAPETEFVFRCFASPSPGQRQASQNSEVFRPFDARDEKTVTAMFTRALNQLGFGAKTAVGYGRFKVLEYNFPEAAEKQLLEAKKTESPEEIRAATFEQFCQSLPGSAGFPGKASEIIRRIESFEDTDLKRMCAKAVLEVVRSNLKKALKAKKAWAIALTELCKTVGVNI